MENDNNAEVSLKICPYNYTCCQTKTLDRSGHKDYVVPNKNKIFNREETLGSCYHHKFPMEKFKKGQESHLNTVIQSVELTYKPKAGNNDMWGPKSVIVCFNDGQKPHTAYHSLWCKYLEDLGSFGPGKTTKQLIENCRWHKGYLCWNEFRRRLKQ